jgi:hypothetical protein
MTPIHWPTRVVLALTVTLLPLHGPAIHAQQSIAVAGDDGRPLAATTASGLVPTAHPVLSPEVSSLWFAPPSSPSVRRDATTVAFGEAMKLADEQSYAKALPLLSRPSMQQGVLGPYAAYYAAQADLRLGRPAEARAALRRLGA